MNYYLSILISRIYFLKYFRNIYNLYDTFNIDIIRLFINISKSIIYIFVLNQSTSRGHMLKKGSVKSIILETESGNRTSEFI